MADVRQLFACAIVAAWSIATAATGDAPWIYLGDTDSATLYFDPSSVRVVGDRKRVWRLFDQKQRAAEDRVKSGKALIEFDCTGGTYRYVRTMYFGGRMGHGPYLGGAGEQPAEYIGPGSMVAYLARTVCEPTNSSGPSGSPANR